MAPVGAPTDHAEAPPRRLWWISPAGVVALMIPATLALVAALPDTKFRSDFRTPKVVTSGTIELYACGAAAFALAAALPMLRRDQSRSGAWPSLSAIQLTLLRRASVILFRVTLAGYLALLLVAIKRGLRLPTIVNALIGLNTESNTLRHLFAPVTGITTLTQTGVAFVVVAALLCAHRINEGTRRRLAVVLILGTFRAYALNERLAILELLIPLGAVLAMSKSGSRSPRTRLAVRLAPLLLVPALVLVFSAFEYSRSYVFFASRTHQSALSFGVGRLAGYYATSYNNGQLSLTYARSPTRLPYDSLEGLWTAPGVKQLDLYRKLTGRDETSFFDELLAQHANREFNSPGGLAIPFVDFGIGGGFVFLFSMGCIIGFAYRRFCAGGGYALLIYPVLVTGLFELPRYLYWTQGRAWVGLAALLVTAHVLCRHGIKRSTQGVRDGS
jgi:hypothetical protein